MRIQGSKTTEPDSPRQEDQGGQTKITIKSSYYSALREVRVLIIREIERRDPIAQTVKNEKKNPTYVSQTLH